MTESAKRILVIGVGNLLLGDDGAGIHAINELSKESFPANVEIVDGGTAGIDLLYWLEEADYAVIIDCLDAGDEPGAIFRLPVEEITSRSSENASEPIVSVHDLNLQGVLQLAYKLKRLPPTVIFGVQPANIGLSESLSEAVGKVLPSLVQAVKKEIYRTIDIFDK